MGRRIVKKISRYDDNQNLIEKPSSSATNLPSTSTSNADSILTNSETREEEETENVPNKRMASVNIVYKGNKYKIPPLFRDGATVKNQGRTLLNDTLIEFYLCHWMVDRTYDDEAREKFHVFHTFFYTKLKLRFSQFNTNAPPRRSELSDIYFRLFQKVKPGIILNKTILVIPIHLDRPKHWFLVIVHKPYGAIRRAVTPPKRSSSGKEEEPSLCEQISDFAAFEEETDECRIMIMDSLCHSEKYKEVLNKAHSKAFEHIRLWLMMAASANGDLMISSRVRKIVCSTLPRQKNSVDCGIYMIAFAEYFTWFNTEWMDIPTDSLEFLLLEDQLTEMLNSEEPRLRLDRLVQHLKAPEEEEES